jgi:hypothetical protein
MTAPYHQSLVAQTAAVAFVLLLFAGCAAGPGTSPVGGASPSAAAGLDGAASPTAVPGPIGTEPSAPARPDEPVTGGGSGGDPGTGVGSSGDPGVIDPGEPEPTLVTSRAGLTGVHPVAATRLDTALNGRDLAVRVAWWSGVEPCSVLAGVDVARDGDTFTLTVREGSAAPPDTACIEIAQYKATIVDLGELEPGTYTITAFGDAAPVTVTID